MKLLARKHRILRRFLQVKFNEFSYQHAKNLEFLKGAPRCVEIALGNRAKTLYFTTHNAYTSIQQHSSAAQQRSTEPLIHFSNQIIA